jgi:EmrB/QacA subfamily drug resistance transporter
MLESGARSNRAELTATAQRLEPGRTNGNRSNGSVSSVNVSHTSRTVVFLTVSVALFMASVDQTIVATGLPTLDHSLHAPVNWGGWTITIYQLGQAIAMPVAGRISDQLGRKTVFLAAAVIFTASSLLCGLSNSIYVLVGLRFIQSLGGGAFMPSATGIVADHFGDDRDRAIGMFSSIFPLGALVGPVLGGVIINYWSWRGIFFINVPIGIAFTLVAAKVLPKSKRGSGEADLIGAGQFGAMIAAIMFAITSLGNGNTGLLSPSFLVPIAVGLVLGFFFVRRANRVAHPILPLMLLKGKAFAVMNTINFVFGACALGFGALVPLYAEDAYHLHPLQAGTLLTARAIGMILVAAAASMMLRRTGYRLPMIVGFALISLGLVLMATQPPVLGPYGWLALGAAVTGLGIGVSGPASNNAILELALGDIAALAGLRGMFRQVGGIFGISVATALLARSGEQSMTLSHVFLALAALLLAMLPMVFLVPDRRRTVSDPGQLGLAAD